MRSLIALIKLFALASILIVGSGLGWLLSFVPFKIRNAGLSNWLSVAIAKSYMRIFNVKLDCQDRHKLRNHQGFIFPTHDSFLDIILPASIVPVRFLAAREVRDRPFLGRLAEAVGCIFVDRGNKQSRKDARQSLTNLTSYPPIIIYPEGMLDGKPGIAPFRHGAFEIARNNEMPFMLVTLLYDDFWQVRWKDESMLKAIWRVAKKKSVKAKLIALPVVHPTLQDDVIELARSAEKAIIKTIAAYGYADYADVSPTDVPQKPSNSWETESVGT